MFLSKDTSHPINYGNFGDENHCFACLLSNEWCDNFAKHLNLELAPNKRMKGLRSNGASSNIINHGALSLHLLSSIQIIHVFIGQLATGGEKRVGVRVLEYA